MVPLRENNSMSLASPVSKNRNEGSCIFCQEKIRLCVLEYCLQLESLYIGGVEEKKLGGGYSL